MSFIEGIGDEVTNFFVIIISSVILYFAWRSTNVRDERIPRNLIIIESNRRRLLDRVAQNPITISILRSTSQHSSTSTEIDELSVEDDGLTSEETGVDLASNIHIQEAPTLEAILDEVGELTSGNSYTQRNREREREQFEIIREMDRDDTDGIRQRHTGLRTGNVQDTFSFSNVSNDNATTSTSTSTSASALPSSTSQLMNDSRTSKTRLNHQDSNDKSTNTDNCTNENCENGNVFESFPYDRSESGVLNESESIANRSDQPMESKESEFRIKLKYLNDELKLVKGCPNEFIGDFKKRNFTDELSMQKIVRLVFNGHVLQPDTKTLKACGLFDNCVVHCLVHNPRPYSNLTSNADNNLSEQDNNHQAGIETENGNATATINASERLLLLGMCLICLTLVFCWYFRIQYYHLFSWYSTIGLILLTCLFLIIIPLLYLIERETVA